LNLAYARIIQRTILSKAKDSLKNRIESARNRFPENNFKMFLIKRIE
jgi:hypothetical protein